MRSARLSTPTVLFLFLLFLPALAGAQGGEGRARIRAAGHGDYSRLVFEWPGAVGYTLERPEPGRLLLKFAKGSELDTAGFASVPNVAALAVESENPLTVAISIPENSRTRDMAAGNRVVVDVYNPPEEKPGKKPPAKKAEKPPAQKAAAKKKSGTPEAKEPVSKEPEKPETAKAPESRTPEAKTSEKPPQPGAATPPAPATEKASPSAIMGPERPAPAAPQTAKIKPSARPTVIVFSSTQGFGLAAFELAGNLVIVNDKSDILIAPQVSGPLAAQIGQPEEIRTGQGKVYVSALPEPDMKLAGQGGGLVWRVMAGGDTAEKQAAPLRRQNVDPEAERSGEVFFPLEGARAVIDMEDPSTGQKIRAVTVSDATAFAGNPRSFIDFDVLRSPIGLAVVPKVDDLDIRIDPAGVTISRPGGLTMLGEDRAAGVAASLDKPPDAGIPRLFDFRGWQLGGIPAVAENRTLILGGLKGMDESARAEGLLTLAKMYISNAMGVEALGVLRLAELEMPALKDSPEFAALNGVAHALSQHMEDAFTALSRENLSPFIETGYWRAYALAGLGDWQQAADALPQDVSVLGDYPDVLLNRIAPDLAEVALRAGDVPLGGKILARLEKGRASMEPHQAAALDYLKGEAARQKGKTEDARRLWKPLAAGTDDLYRVRANLALTRLADDAGTADTGKTIDALERLRYAWRGDELESQVSYWLGRAYFQSGDYIKGLKIMREATTFAPETELAKRIAGDMTELFSGLFLGPEFEKLSPLDAVTLYDQFPELAPPGGRGNRIAERLAEYLVQADLPGRAGDILDYQIRHRLAGEDAFRAAMRLAAIRLIDNQPARALEALEGASRRLEMLPDEIRTPENYRALAMLRARAFSRQAQPARALELLRGVEQTPDVTRLRADIAWTARNWAEAAEALGEVLDNRDISLTRPLEDGDAALLMQRAVALNLSGDRVALANMREKYTDLMNQTEKAKIFEVITRPRQSSLLADRETLMGIVSEVDLFADFLKSYKTVEIPPSPPE